MPSAPKVLCRGGCGRPVQRGYCEACKSGGVQRLERPTANARGYDYRHQRDRELFLRANPLCVDPDKRHAGLVVLATVLDHIVPHRGDLRLLRDPSNWQPLCEGCHGYKTATRDGGFGRLAGAAAGAGDRGSEKF